MTNRGGRFQLEGIIISDPSVGHNIETDGIVLLLEGDIGNRFGLVLLRSPPEAKPSFSVATGTGLSL